jgi:hypothetical protein
VDLPERSGGRFVGLNLLLAPGSLEQGIYLVLLEDLGVLRLSNSPLTCPRSLVQHYERRVGSIGRTDPSLASPERRGGAPSAAVASRAASRVGASYPSELCDRSWLGPCLRLARSDCAYCRLARTSDVSSSSRKRRGTRPVMRRPNQRSLASHSPSSAPRALHARFADEGALCRGFFMMSCIVPSSPKRVSQETVQRTREDQAVGTLIADGSVFRGRPLGVTGGGRLPGLPRFHLCR